MTQTHPCHIALAAGGTGGHLFPAVSLAETLVRRGHRVSVLTDARGGAFEAPGAPWEVHHIRAASPSAPGLLAKGRAAFQLALGLLDARRTLKRLGVDAVAGFGGYPSAPTVLAASALGLPVILHEQNAVLGRANRWLARRADAIALSFDETRGVGERVGESETVRRTGNPVRAAILAERDTPYSPPTPDQPFALLVFGGSLGARVLSDCLPAAGALLAPDLRARLTVTQQCRTEDVARVRDAWQQVGVTALVEPFFTDMAPRLAAAHLVVARAGAGTVAELAVIGRPAVLVPFARAMDDHQSANAEAMVAAGGALVCSEADLTPELLAARLTEAMRSPDTLTRLAAAAHAFGAPEAAEHLADMVLEAARGRITAAREVSGEVSAVSGRDTSPTQHSGRVIA